MLAEEPDDCEAETIQPGHAAPPAIQLPIPNIWGQEGAVPLDSNNNVEVEGAGGNNIFPGRELGARMKVKYLEKRILSIKLM